VSSTSRPLTILLSPESAYGPTNQCIGIGNILVQRGHRVVFAAESSWQGRLKPLGFEEQLVDLSEPASSGDDQDPGVFWTEFIRDTSPEFRKPTVEQLETFIRPTWEALIAGAQYCEPRLRQILEDVRPDVIVEDNVVGFPALVTNDAPFVRIVSCNPLEVPDDGIAPAFSGLAHDDPDGWAAFRAEYDRTHRAVWTAFNEWMVSQGAPELPDLQFIHESLHANLYVYPAEADYDRLRPLGDTWHRLDSSVRETDDNYLLPAAAAARPDDSALVYLSLGSLGGADVELMRRLVDVLGRTRHSYVVSKGPMGELIDLPANMVGAPILPQTKVIPQVDLVITHGGNNTTTEALHFGKPMIVLPLFWDQYDNAQRMHELGLGVRLETYAFTDEQLTSAVDRLLADTVLRARTDNIGQRIRERQGLRTGADIIERIARGHADALTIGLIRRG
jgi:MGT family glycosyltransferase